MVPSDPPRFSVLDLAPVRVGGTIAEAFRNTLDLAQHAEQWGFTRFWLAEHHNMPGIASAATSLLIGYVAGGTSTIRVGSGGVMLPNHSALVIAEQFGTLETLYPGRIDLGVGRAPGSDGMTSKALRYNTKEEDFPPQVGELLAYLGPSGPGQRLRAYPGAGTNVPVWLLGSTTYSAQLAAALGVPFAFASQFAPALLMEAIEAYREGFTPSKHLDKSYVVAGVPLVAAETDSEAQRLATSALQRHLKLIRGEPVFVPPPVDSMAGLWSEAEHFLVESRLGAAVIGGPETVRQKLTQFLRETGPGCGGPCGTCPTILHPAMERKRVRGLCVTVTQTFSRSSSRPGPEVIFTVKTNPMVLELFPQRWGSRSLTGIPARCHSTVRPTVKLYRR